MLLSTTLLVSSGCGLSGILADATNKVIDKQAVRIDDKLRAKYGIVPEDNLSTAAKKMFEIESEDDPNLAGILLKVGPEAWDEIKELADSEKSLTEKVVASIALAGKFKGGLDDARDENGTIKWASGGTGMALLLLILRSVLKHRSEKRKKEGLMDSVELMGDGSDAGAIAKENMKKAMKIAMDKTTFAEMSADVANRFPAKETKSVA